MSQPNKGNLRLWVEGLRSGQFTQGTGTLKRRRPDGTYQYCCLGVACEVAKANGVPLVEEKPDEWSYFDGEGSALPAAVIEWLGMSGTDPDVRPGTSAISANDGVDTWSFERIADGIVATYNLEETDEPAE